MSACAGAPQAQYPITRPAPAGEALIVFKDPALAGAKAERVWHLGAFEHLEYVRFETEGLTVEAVYDTATDNQAVLDYPYWLESMAETWHAGRGQASGWGPPKQARAWHGTIDYRTYRQAQTGRHCAAFQSEWDYTPRDPLGRPGKVLFGYVCAAPGGTLSDQQAETLLQSVAIDQRPDESFVPVLGRASVDPAAVAMANGSARPGTGNAAFPFDFGTYYFEGESPLN